MRNIKKKLVMFGALCVGLMLPIAASSLQQESVKADTLTPTTAEFYMQEGAAVRTTSDELGIRFGATITQSYWQDLQTEYGADATYTFYSVVTDGTTPITKNYEGITPSFGTGDTYTFYSTIVYKTEELKASGLLEAACNLSLSARTYIDITKEGETEPVTLEASGETGARSMKAVANAAVLAGNEDEDLFNYFTEGNRSEATEGYIFQDDSVVIEMDSLPDLTDATDVEVYYGAQKVDATYADGAITFSGVALEEGKTEAYISVFTGGNVYSSKVAKATKITQANATDLLSLTGGETVYLAEDIDLAGIEWNTTVTFSGVFDGGNHAIKNLTTVASNGFFTVLSGTVKNVAFTNVTLTAGTAVLAYRGGTTTSTVENVFIQVVKTNSSGSNRFGVICERQNNAVAMNLTNVVIKMPGTAANEAIYGYTLKGTSSLTNVHCIGLPNEAASIQNAGTQFKGTYTLHPTLESFSTAKTTLTPFLDKCVKEYLNLVKISQANVGDLLTLKGSENVILLEDIDLAGITWNSTVTFSGVFDGNNHAIKNLTTVASNGFFTVLSGTVKNVAFTNVTLTVGTAVLAYRGGTTTSTVENVFIQVVKTNSSGSNRFGVICERQNNAAAMNLTNVVIKMPGTAANEAIYGYTLKGVSTLTNVHCIGLPNEAASIQNVGTYFTGTYTLHPTLGDFNEAEKTLTDFLTSCVASYLNA